MAAVTASQKYFDPKTLASIQPLGLRARTLIEGVVAGTHRSPLRGHSIEFAQHREYTPGDDVRQVDWKVYARSDKHYVKQYEDETNLLCYLLVDQSESMQYRGESSALSKLDYSHLVACSLAYLVITQQDSAGLITFSAGIDDWLAPSSSPNQFEDMIRVLEQGRHDQRTNVASAIEQSVQRISRPGVLVIISDLLDDIDQLQAAFRLARYAKHDVLVIQVLDSDEVDFPFDQLSRFEGLENQADLITDPLLIGGAYRRAMRDYCQSLDAACRKLDIDYFQLHTNQPLSVGLPSVLASRRLRRS